MRNRRVAGAVRTILDVIGGVDRRRAMRLLEAVSMLVVFASRPGKP